MKIVRENNKQKLPRISAQTSRWVIASLSLGAIGSAHAASEFHLRGEVNVNWTDNVTLVSDNDPNKESAYIAQVNPGFLWTINQDRLQATLDYTMQNLFYLSDSDRNSTYHQGNLTAEAVIAKDYLFLDASAMYSQQIIDPELPTNGGNLFITGNAADALAAQIAPVLRHDFKFVHVDASYTRGLVNYKSHANGGNADALEDADTESTHVLLSNVEDDGRRFTWKTVYLSQLARYEASPDFRYDEANLELGMLIGKDVRLIGRGGLESDPTLDQSKGGLDASYWEAGLQWRPGRRTNVEGFYGHRFYGTSYSASVSHEARQVKMEIAYTEGPSTQAQDLANQPHSFGNVVPGTNYFSRPTSDVYVHKTLDGTIHITGSRTDIDLKISDYKRDYLDAALGAEFSRGAALAFTRKLSARGNFVIGGAFYDNELRDGKEYDDLDFRMELNRLLSEKVKLALTLHRVERTGDLAYDANVATLSLSGTF